jgi:hypothetical protein
MTDPVTHASGTAADNPLPELAALAAEHLTFICPLADDRFLRCDATPVGDYVVWELARVFPPENTLRVRLRLELDTDEAPS